MGLKSTLVIKKSFVCSQLTGDNFFDIELFEYGGLLLGQRNKLSLLDGAEFLSLFVSGVL